ncbi:MAG: tetratricopeptide repeat protein [Bacteroides sp.]|nr:tetratricopeptide repeat protein [Bacteroides sp.]
MTPGGSSSDSDNSRRELYERFLSDLRKDRRVMFYDLDDLVELYDYANDIQDKYVAMEVLFCGERLYPESTDLAERRALFYFGYDEDAAMHAVESLPSSSMIGVLLSLRLKRAIPEVAVPALDRLLAERAEFTDEEIIQLADTAEELGLYSWLVENKDKICAHTDYPQTFLYELTQIAMEQEPETALKLLEELTMLEPFAADFWLTMAQIYVYLSSPEKALQALDYALAIDPDNIRALMLKAQCFNDMHHSLDQVEPILRRVMSINPGVTAAPLALALLYANEGRTPEARSILLDLYASVGPEPQLLDVMLTVSDGDIEPSVIESFLSTDMRDYADNYIEMAKRHASDGRHGASAALILAIDKAYGVTVGRDFMMEELYHAGRYEDVVERIRAAFADPLLLSETSSDLSEQMQIYIYILSMLRLGHRLPEMLAAVGNLIRQSRLDVTQESAETLMKRRSLIKLLIKLHSRLSGDATFDIDDVDPFVHGLI